MDTDGDGVNDGKEYGYYGGLAEDMSNKTLMVDVPFMYINGGDDYNFNGLIIFLIGGYSNCRFKCSAWCYRQFIRR
jgi:hypothetical protein